MKGGICAGIQVGGEKVRGVKLIPTATKDAWFSVLPLFHKSWSRVFRFKYLRPDIFVLLAVEISAKLNIRLLGIKSGTCVIIIIII
jgi:hypothetical protein